MGLFKDHSLGSFCRQSPRMKSLASHA